LPVAIAYPPSTPALDLFEVEAELVSNSIAGKSSLTRKAPGMGRMNSEDGGNRDRPDQHAGYLLMR